MNTQHVIKRDGTRAEFDGSRIRTAIAKAMEAAGGDPGSLGLDGIVEEVVSQIGSSFPERSPGVEDIQDIVEQRLVAHGLYEVSKAYILYRERRRAEREREQAERIRKAAEGNLQVAKRDGSFEPFDGAKIRRTLESASAHVEIPDLAPVIEEFERSLFDGISAAQIHQALILAATAFVERDPAYNRLAAGLLMQQLRRDVFGASLAGRASEGAYKEAFVAGIRRGVENGIFDARLGGFDLDRLAGALRTERDDEFTYLGLQTLYERYLVKDHGRLLETPQAFWMRVAMGLSLREDDPTARAEEFYENLSSLRFLASTPTLFHSGLTRPQLSSCYLSTVGDDLTHIFKVMSDNAQLSKWSGGIGNDWTRVRATGAHINSTGVESQGIVPFLKIANDTTLAINRSGKRRGATCAYLETWHLDIEDFLDLRRNTGDDRRRTHDMNTANWIPDLFMKRVREEGPWTLFSPEEVPDLHDLYGKAFEERYTHYEAEAKAGRINQYRVVEAVKLWRKMLTRLFETGHPWITFKDPANIRSPQDHDGVVHNSNLCTEITLNNSDTETAVCNLGSVNLSRHVTAEGVDHELLSRTVSTAMRMLDNVIDINFYPTEEARRSNMRHRPVGLGLMGFQDALFKLRRPFDSRGAQVFADEIMEFISYHAILASSKLAAERGAYESFPGSKWDRGIFPLDTLDLLEAERGVEIPVPRTTRMDWTPVREHVARHGMRNSNTMAVAPTATISNIAGSYPCIEPIYKNIYVKSNMSGEFTVINEYLVNDLKARGLWNQEMLEELKAHDGDVGRIDAVPAELKELYKEAFEIDATRLVQLTALRGKWIDQSQSHNVFMKGVSGKKLEEIYMAAWELGLKTTYYLRSLGASQIEKSTLDAKKYGYTQKREAAAPKPAVAAGSGAESALAGGSNGNGTGAAGSAGDAATGERPTRIAATAVTTDAGFAASIANMSSATEITNICSLDDPDCEACQ
ncbi:MAG: ribonucleoside-diphosphate reductase subunit alpha [Spirochaetaceae bacterium]